jgi:hypothetical protein
MRPPLWMMPLLTGLLAGCADLGPGDMGPDGAGGAGLASKAIPVACGNNFLPATTSILEWELTVTPGPIEGGKPFTVILDGVAVFDENFFDNAQALIGGGVREVNLVDINATVHVRSGADGSDVTLKNEPIRHECFVGRTICDPAHDLSGMDGLRGNTDCQPEGDLNPCGRFVLLPTSTDCGPGGVCDGLGKVASQCALNGFCITGGLRLPLEEERADYTADDQGDVLFGWDDESSGAIVQVGGPNHGTWILPAATLESPTGRVGLRAGIGDLLVALECTMGVDSKGPDGVNSFEFLSSPAPDSRLISLPIETH